MRLNPKWAIGLATDKAVFYSYAAGLGIPVPPLCAIFTGPGSGFTPTGQILCGLDDWRQLFDSLPSEFVVKPADACYGSGFNRFTRNNGTFIDGAGVSLTPEALYQWLATHNNFHKLVIQHRLWNHSSLRQLSGTDSLQTLRLATYVNPDGNVEICDSVFKLIVGKNLTDNFHWGTTGNLVSRPDPDTGILGPAMGDIPHRPRPRLPHHPPPDRPTHPRLPTPRLSGSTRARQTLRCPAPPIALHRLGHRPHRFRPHHHRRQPLVGSLQRYRHPHPPRHHPINLNGPLLQNLGLFARKRITISHCNRPRPRLRLRPHPPSFSASAVDSSPPSVPSRVLRGKKVFPVERGRFRGENREVLCRNGRGFGEDWGRFWGAFGGAFHRRIWPKSLSMLNPLFQTRFLIMFHVNFVQEPA